MGYFKLKSLKGLTFKLSNSTDKVDLKREKAKEDEV